MRKIFYNISVFALTAVMLVSPLFAVFAQSGSGGNSGNTGGNSGNSGGNSLFDPTKLTNPLGDITIQQFFVKVIQILLVFAVPIIVFFIILAGFKYVTARGNTEKISQATTALTWALVGGVIILGAELILQVIKGTVCSLATGAPPNGICN